MLRNAIAVLAIVLVLGSSGLSTAHLPAAPVVVVTLAAASVVLPVTAMAVMAIAPAVCVPDPVGTGAAMCGATRAPIMGP